MRLSSTVAALAALIFSGVQAQGSAAQSFRDCPSCPEMMAIPPGAFTMGVAAGEEEREGVDSMLRGRSAPQVRVTIGYGFAMGRYEVTRGEFQAFVQATGRRMGELCYAPGPTGRWDRIQGRSWQNPGFAQTDRHPVLCVTFGDATDYAAWLSRTTGKRYRLPSEAEWEYAARAGTTQARPWSDSRDACRHANVADLAYAGNLPNAGDLNRYFQCNDRHAQTAPVGQFQANAFGLHDMLGNVSEWMLDCFAPSHAGVPADGSPRTGGDCRQRVLRGGNWNAFPAYVRLGYRNSDPVDDRAVLVGFRVVRTD